VIVSHISILEDTVLVAQPAKGSDRSVGHRG
jgi:hypothetical protein